ncbi:MAG: TonB-dependent receptor [Balneolaceae bacterium]|nr:TonB-dependent receptor [Balneolaceae bacterium]
MFCNRLFSYLLISFVFLPYIAAQTSVTGSVSEVNSEPGPFANVLLLNPGDSSLVKGAVTDKDGQFDISNVEMGEYLLAVTNIGYTTKYVGPFSVDKEASELDQGSITIREATAQLETVTVKARKPLFEQKVDRLVINVSNSIASAGGTALEVLERSPGVMVNKEWGLLSLGGKQGVVIMINGKISRMPATAVVQMLDGMSADNIETIELIHTPPANFEAEGNAGIIHIVLKESAGEGLQGNYSLNAGYGRGAKAGGNFNFNYRKKGFNLFGDYAYTLNRTTQVFENFRSFELAGKIYETLSTSDRDPTSLATHQARLGLDIALTDKTVVGVLTAFSGRYWDMDAFTETVRKVDDKVSERIDTPNDEINQWNNILGNVNLQHSFSEDKVLNIDLDYVYYDFDNPSNYKNTHFDGNGLVVNETQLRTSKSTPMGIFAAKSDYVHPINDQLVWETGVKATATTFGNDVVVEDLVQGNWIANPLFSADYSLVENIAMAYSSFHLQLGDKASVKAGMRYEYTRSNLGTEEEPDIVDRSYGNWFPSLFYTHTFNEENQFQASYSRRINRPDFTQLAPFFIFYDPTTIVTGNPELQPSITDATSLSYRWRTLQFSLQYSYESETIARWQPTIDVDSDIQINGARNFDYLKTVAATFSFPLHPTTWWEIRNNISLQWQGLKDEFEGTTSKFDQSSWNYNGSMTFSLPAGFTAELSGYYFSPTLYGSLEVESMSELTIGLQKQLSNGKGTFKISYSDLFQGSNWVGRLHLPENDLRYRGSYQFAERVFRISYSKSFGNSKVKAARERETGSSEERQRVN